MPEPDAKASTGELVELAAVVRPHALHGELVLKLFNAQSELLPSLREVILRAPTGERRVYEVRGVRGAGAHVLLTLEGVRSREQADALRGSLVCVERAALPPLEEGEYYLIDLPGLEVRTPAGAVIGHVEDVIEYPSASCLMIITDGLVRELPQLPRYVPEVRVSEGFVVVDHLEEIEPVPLAALKGKR
jgi:16S rRNA processing protein RimM